MNQILTRVGAAPVVPGPRPGAQRPYHQLHPLDLILAGGSRHLMGVAGGPGRLHVVLGYNVRQMIQG